jgi:hypothetical protein
VVATGNAAEDKEAEDIVLDGLERHGHIAWCYVMVEACWDTFRGSDSLGSCSFSSQRDEDFQELVRELRLGALEDLNKEIARAARKLEGLA